jgi:hypothetical protein
MRRSILFAAALAGGLTLAAGAEADGRHGPRGGHARMFHHGQQFAQPSSLRVFAPRPQVRHFGSRSQAGCFAAPGCGPRFGHWQPVPRFASRPPVPLSRQPGYRVLAGRQILPTVGIPVRPLVQPVIVRPRHHYPTFVRVVPGPGLPRQAWFGSPHRQGGLTIIVRDPGRMRAWQ